MLAIFDTVPMGPEDLPSPADFDAFHPFLKGVFSQWHATAFDLEGFGFVTAEQWMMFAKAKLFEDETSADAIRATDDPSEQKRLGASVASFEQDVWDQWKVEIVYRGSLAKFSQNAGARRQLKSTAPAMLVEANPRDWIWGVGLSADNPAVNTYTDWKGENLLGRILTKVRHDVA